MHLGCLTYDTRFTFWAVLSYALRTEGSRLATRMTLFEAHTVDEQLEQFQELLRQRVDAIVFGGVTSTAEYLPVLEQARALHIPVVQVNGMLDEALFASSVRADERAGIDTAAEFLHRVLAGVGTIALIAGPSSDVRADMMRAALASYPEIICVSAGYGDWQRASGERLARAVLAQHPDVRAIFAANDLMALGAGDAVAQAGRSAQVLVVGFDGLPEALRGVYDGTISATVRQSPDMIGRAAVALALRAWHGAQLPPLMLVPTTLITPANLASSLLELVDLMPGMLRDLIESANAGRKLQEEIITAQRSLIAELSTPVIPITDGILVLPIVGEVDTGRARQITETVLRSIAERHTETMILDITGMTVFDTGVAQHLLQTVRAARLLGARVMLVGISPEIAQTIVQLGVDLTELPTYRSLQEGLARVLRRIR